MWQSSVNRYSIDRGFMQPIHTIALISPNAVRVDGRDFPCAIGRNGLAEVGAKREGDLKTPRGIFPLRALYHRPDRVPMPVSGLVVTALTPSMGWCDDPAHAYYNQRVELPFAARHEKLWREDGVYDLVIPLGYNDGPIQPGAGSAIFLHLMREDGVGTEGCVAVARETLMEWLPRLTPKTVLVTAV